MKLTFLFFALKHLKILGFMGVIKTDEEGNLFFNYLKLVLAGNQPVNIEIFQYHIAP